MRIGHGFDVHAFGGEGPIIIGGVRIPYEKGLLAHSDGDVALHALTDAFAWRGALGISASCSRDTDPAFKGADSRELLREAGVVFRRRVMPWQRRCHYHRSGTEDVAAHSHKCACFAESRLPYG